MALVRRRAFEPASVALVTLGRAVLERGRALDADAIFAEAAAHARSGGDERGSAGARVWQAAARTDAAQLSAAEALCRAVLVSGVLTGVDLARAEATLARTLLWQERVDEAAARDLTDPHAHGVPDTFVGATAVRVWLARADVFRAGQCARGLLTAAGTSSDPMTRVVALTAHARVLMEAGDLTLAERCLAELRAAVRVARAPLRLLRVRVFWGWCSTSC
jgi:hypothetical protein